MRQTREVNIAEVKIGGGNPIAIQSMCNTDTRNIKATVRQIKELEEAGCEIVRVAVLNMEAADAVTEIKKQISIPLVADIHFDYRLALQCIENGIDKLRINPGNIGSKERTAQVVSAAKERGIPIRIGVNAGSLSREITDKYGVSAEALIQSAMEHIEILEDLNFYNTIISIKSSSIRLTIEAYQQISEKIDYPLHVGITESGTVYAGSIKSSVGLGIMLYQGIGDTIRVSLTGNPVEEIKCAKEILKALELRRFGVEFISCPTCGRTEIDLISLANKAEEYCNKLDKNIKVAIMGCAVNGPGEAKEADIGIAGGRGCGFIFKKGKIVSKVPESELLEALVNEIKSM